MTDWTSGYVTEIAYTHGYYSELKPLLMRQALLRQGVHHRCGEKLRYLELGFGQGVSLNIHAAATGGEFWGCDFNPAQAANAQELATASGANVTVLDASFEELAARTDLPTFDVIALHGIWSWISETNRQLIVEIARRHLAVGGVFYVSYNRTPGWSANMPLRHLMTLHAEFVSGKAQGLEPRIDSALDFAQSLADGNAAYFRTNPAATEWLKAIKDQARSYVAHEYFNADWHPMAFSDMARYLSEAKLSFAASAHLLDHIDAVIFTPDQQKLLQAQSHPVLRESVRDYLVNQRFRRDIWVKGPRPMAPLVHAELAQSQAYTLVTVRETIPLKVQGLLGEMELQSAVYDPLLDALADKGYAAKTLGQLRQLLPNLSLQQIAEGVTILSGLGYIQSAQSSEAARAAKPACDRLNAHLVKKAIYSGDVLHLASPVTGGGIGVTRIEQLFIKALKGGRKTPSEWARETLDVLAAQGQRLTKDGKILESPDDNLAEFSRQAVEFDTKALPVLRALQVA